ncbi:MAG: iron-sulfur cluster assembly scaffold protein [Syntrophorhabdaceae bacterium]|nr:iron-sulfur cluster assembly scaffold protein [Syntrophorhabdaceae bacterium]
MSQGPYSDTVIDHFEHPRNMGEMEGADGIAQVGNPTCGDVTKIFLRIEGDRIVDAKFKTFGCAAAIASSSMTTELIKGKTIDEALKLTNEIVARELGGLPEAKQHCSVMAEAALRAAVEDYRNKQGK